MEVLGKRLPTELCSGRRLKGHSATMTENTASASAPGVRVARDDAATASALATTTFVLESPRDPGRISGSGDPDEVDVENWLAEYERVSTRYRSGPTLMLANLLFYFKGTAMVRYDTMKQNLGAGKHAGKKCWTCSRSRLDERCLQTKCLRLGRKRPQNRTSKL